MWLWLAYGAMAPQVGDAGPSRGLRDDGLGMRTNDDPPQPLSYSLTRGPARTCSCFPNRPSHLCNAGPPGLFHPRSQYGEEMSDCCLTSNTGMTSEPDCCTDTTPVTALCWPSVGIVIPGAMHFTPPGTPPSSI